ncbi:uncharacterized protein LOC141534095 [Cotesia typhae]|uniref:uncharacterized protein LOC141528653 n=1 Tax=Cotesia typhae TaxID=2053667 RepID=UPI003D68D739
MTARLNQDKLEQFFGIVRSACGCNEHPDPIIFGQVFRLLCSYSLVTPPKGSNVTAVELLQSLMETKESLMLIQDKKSKWLQKLDSIIDNGFIEEDDIYRRKSVAVSHFENLVDTSEDDTDVTSATNDSSKSRTMNFLEKRSVAKKPFESLVDSSEDENNNVNLDSAIADGLQANDPHEHHDYDVVSTSEFVVSYIAGYVARKMQRFSRCHLCLASLESDKSSHRDRVIDLMSEQCIRPSNNLYSLIQQLENIVLTVVGTKTVRFDTMNCILDKVAEEKSLPFVGCQEHQFTLMKKY